jgi:hypothetical protein
MIEGNFCQKTCGRCAPAASSDASQPAAAPPRASPPALSAAPTPPTTEIKAPLVEDKLGITAKVVAAPTVEEPAAQDPVPALPQRAPRIEKSPLPLPQTEPTPAQEQYLEALTSEAATLSSGRETPVQRLPALTLAPQTEQPQQAATAATTVGPPVVAPANETQANNVQSPPPAPKAECNTTSAWDVLSSDPQLSTTRQAAETMNLKSVLQNPNIKFTVRLTNQKDR